MTRDELREAYRRLQELETRTSVRGRRRRRRLVREIRLRLAEEARWPLLTPRQQEIRRRIVCSWSIGQYHRERALARFAAMPYFDRVFHLAVYGTVGPGPTSVADEYPKFQGLDPGLLGVVPGQGQKR